MNWLRLARARWLGFLHQEEIDAETDEELRFHLAMRTEENLARGMSPSEARRQAGLRFGNLNAIKDSCREISGGGMLESVWQDAHFAGRMLRRDRGFTAVAVLALALGIGANAALFTVISGVLLRPLPFPQSNEIVAVASRESSSREGNQWPLSYPDYQDLAARNRSFATMGAFVASNFILETSAKEVTDVPGAVVTPEVIPLLGIAPILGRVFTADENAEGNRSIVISEDLWRERFDGKAEALGAKINVDAFEYSIIGVMPRSFRFPLQNSPAQLWVTFGRNFEALGDGGPPPAKHRDAHFAKVIGRLQNGVSIRDAQADLSAIAADLAQRFPRSNARTDACLVSPWLTDLTKSVRPALLMLAAAALCVLCVACVNVANLLLARANVRLKEIAIRCALGAGRRRILRQLLTESLLLAALGGSVGLLLALGGTHYIVSVLPPSFPRLAEISPDLGVLTFTSLLILLTSCVFGFAPAWCSAHCDLATLLNEGSRGSIETPRSRRASRLLVVAQMALSFVLLATACYLIRGLWKLENAAPGFEAQDVFVASFSAPDNGGPDGPARSADFYRELLERVCRMKGVESASAVYPLPLTVHRTIADFEIMGHSTPKADWPRARAHTIGVNYFRTMQIPLLRGRDFNEGDRRDAPQVVIINETLARTFFGNENPLGKLIRPGLADSSAPPMREIVGVVGDVKSAGLATTQRPEVYLPHPQCAASEMSVVVHSALSEETLLAELREVTQTMDRTAALHDLRPMEHYLDLDKAQPRLSSSLLGAFALVAVIVTAIGVYGVTSYSVARRRHEIGIRLALGAQKPAVFRLVLAEGARLVLGSVGGGCLLTLCATPFLRNVVQASAGGDAFIIIFVTLLLTGVGFLACSVPAHRAAHEDALAALGQR